MHATLKKELVRARKELAAIDESLVEMIEMRIAKAKKILDFKARHDMDEPVAQIHADRIVELKKLDRRHVDDDTIGALWRRMQSAAVEGFHGSRDAAEAE